MGNLSSEIMARSKLYYLIALMVMGLVIYIVWDALTQPGIGDLNGEFEEVAFYRNENNTGPIVRVYAVTVNDTLWDEMEKYGAFMPHSKYGNTKVYFFHQGDDYPVQVFPGEDNFDPEYMEYCLAVYEKDAMGKVSFRVLD